MGVELFAIFGASSPLVYIVIAGLAFLLFGNRLPSVMRSLGRSVVEFKKGVAGIEDDIDDAIRASDEEATKPKKKKKKVVEEEDEGESEEE